MEVSSTESKEQGAGGKEHDSVPELVEGEKKSTPLFRPPSWLSQDAAEKRSSLNAPRQARGPDV